ncbi:MAG TPA: TlpA disulfide reductase family protein [Pyrinomonadaceae bacterium]|nr:TlpA disulfide reductase family protein [Pyrinomonadaceae bacterium]
MSRKAAAVCLAPVLLLAMSCGRAPTEVSRTETPRGENLPRTSLPMPPITTPGGNAAAAQSFTLMDERRANLSDYLGQVVVLDFWATFCAPCVEEAPHLDELQTRFGPQGLKVIGLNVGGEDDRPEIPKFVERLKIKYALGFPDPEMVNLYMGSDGSIPQTIVFDRRGRVVKHFTGYDPNVRQELESTIEKAVMSEE